MYIVAVNFIGGGNHRTEILLKVALNTINLNGDTDCICSCKCNYIQSQS